MSDAERVDSRIGSNNIVKPSKWPDQWAESHSVVHGKNGLRKVTLPMTHWPEMNRVYKTQMNRVGDSF